MKWTWHLSIMALFLLGWRLPAAAQEEMAPLTLQECLAIALQEQSDVQQGEQSLKAAAARTTQAKSGYYPQVTLQGNSRVLHNATSRNSSDHTASLGISYELYDGGLRKERVKSAEYGVEQNAATLARTKQTVIFTVSRSYLALLRAQRLLDVSESQLAYIDGQRALIDARVAVGDAAAVDLLPVEAQWANAQVDLLAAQNAVRTSAIVLQQAMGLTPGTRFAVQEIMLPDDVAVPTLEECLAQAGVQRPDVVSTQAGVGAAQASVRTAKIGLAPRPVVVGGMDQGLVGGDERTYALSVGVNYDLFNGGNRRAIYDEARAQLSSAQIRAAQIEKDIIAEVQDAYLTLQDARARVQASAVSVEAARRNLAAQEERYKNDLAIPLDLLNAQLQLTTADNNAVQSRYDYYTALARLNYALGKEGAFDAQ